MYNEGISVTGDLLDLGVTSGVIKKSGTYYSYQNTKLGPGREKAKQLLKDSPKLVSELKTKIWEEVKGNSQILQAKTVDQAPAEGDLPQED